MGLPAPQGLRGAQGLRGSAPCMGRGARRCQLAPSCPAPLPDLMSACPPHSSCAVTDPAFLVTRSAEDWVTWVDTSKIKRKVLRYNDKLDDFDIMTG